MFVYICKYSLKYKHFILGTVLTDKTNDARFRFTNCSSPDQVEKMQETYLSMLKTSPYGYFCIKFKDVCHKDNVIVSCD